MRKSIAFLVLMLTTQMALADFLWPRGEKIEMEIYSAFVLENGQYNLDKEKEILSNLEHRSISLKFFSNRTRIWLEIFGNRYECLRQHDHEGTPTRVFICPRPEYKIEITLDQNLRILKGALLIKAPWDEGSPSFSYVLRASIP